MSVRCLDSNDACYHRILTPEPTLSVDWGFYPIVIISYTYVQSLSGSDQSGAFISHMEVVMTIKLMYIWQILDWRWHCMGGSLMTREQIGISRKMLSWEWNRVYSWGIAYIERASYSLLSSCLKPACLRLFRYPYFYSPLLRIVNHEWLGKCGSRSTVSNNPYLGRK